MFALKSALDITITSLRVQLWSGINNIVVYNAPGNYSDKATDSSEWTQIYANSFVQLGEDKCIQSPLTNSFLILI